MITYQTERLILTSMRPEHTAELFQLHADPVVQKIIYDNTPQTIEDVREWVERSLTQWRKNGFGTWIVYQNAVTVRFSSVAVACATTLTQIISNSLFHWSNAELDEVWGWRPHDSPSRTLCEVRPRKR
ncbi:MULTISPECIES: GNAT family N-acetyltransferase [unclassified Mesorhizobium]|uniref:GNAT family N-acetyltransferase n=1 Tax=unclassified Mesorhizobium TaxID=325217 RepID=UPI0033379FDE